MNAEVALRAQSLFQNNRTSKYCKSLSVTLFADQAIMDGLMPNLMANGYNYSSLGFDRVVPYGKLPPLPEKENLHHIFAASPTVWMKRIWAFRRASSERTMGMDADAIPCYHFDQLFDTLVASDVAAIMAPVPFGGSFGKNTKPRPVGLTNIEQRQWKMFRERNLGLLLVASDRPAVASLFAEFESAYLREIRNYDSAPIFHDQPAWREALFVYRGKYTESVIPSGRVCRRKLNCKTCVVLHGKQMRFIPKIVGVVQDVIRVRTDAVMIWNCCQSCGLVPL